MCTVSSKMSKNAYGFIFMEKQWFSKSVPLVWEDAFAVLR